MEFIEVEVLEARGGVLAHTYALGPGVAFKKGRLLDEHDVAKLAKAGVARVFVARLAADDVAEDAAATRIAEAIAGAHVAIARATTGRANLFAAARGILVVEAEGIDRTNLVDERLTIATLRPYAVVSAGEMVATVKVIPFAVPEARVRQATEAAGGPLLRVAPFTRKRAGLVMTTLGAARDTMLERASRSQAQRMAYLGGELVRERVVPHDVSKVAAALGEMLAEGLDLVLVLGASAIVDRLDVVPSAITSVGGVVEHLGMPVDPGNLLLLARAGATPIVGVPGCARSLNPSGFDWVLERLAADIAVTSMDIRRMGAGGLLEEAPARPSPRVPHEPPGKPPRVAALVLAAGMGRRMDGPNKLLEEIGGEPMVARVVDALLASRAAPVVVVVGHEAERVRAALAGRDVRFVVNDDFAEGLGASLRAGILAIEALPGAPVDGALVALGDMPFLEARHVDQLIGSFEPAGRFSICVPVHERRRGHPVLWSARHFPAMRKLGGDVGARALLEQHADAVLAVPIEDPAIHLDVDTAEMLARARQDGRAGGK